MKNYWDVQLQSEKSGHCSPNYEPGDSIPYLNMSQANRDS